MTRKTKLILILLAVVLFFPVYTGTFKDGGTKTFTALTYKVVEWNRITADEVYSKTRIYPFPLNFRSIDSLWYYEQNILSD